MIKILRLAKLALSVGVSLLSSSFVVHPALCEPTRVPLQVGLTYSDVIARWGKPTERQEFEAKREDVWSYGLRARVVFHDGLVASWDDGKQPPDLDADAAKKSVNIPVKESVDSGDVTAILTEIMKVGSDDDKDGRNDGPGENAAGARVPPPMISGMPR